MIRPLSSLIPNAGDLLALEVEELAGALLVHLLSYEGSPGNSVYQNGLISQSSFVAVQHAYGSKPEYGQYQPQVDRALKEAWSWLVSEGLLVHEPGQPAP